MLRFLKAVARAALVNVPRALCDCLPLGGAIFEFARDAAKNWKEEVPRAEDRRAEVAALAVTPAAEVRNQAEQAVAAVAADQPEPVRRALVTYLTQLPGTVRRSLSRPADLSGKTVPGNLALDKPEDVLPFLPPRPSQLRVGQRFGDWMLEELVGMGGFGEVWRATNPHLPPAAFKFCTDSVAAKALKNEAALLGRVVRHGRHAGIVSLDDTNLAHEPPYLRYEFVAGGDLAGLMHEWRQVKAPARVLPALHTMHQLATIVGFAHGQGIVHRDLKPANILLQPLAKGGYTLRVADFGIGGIAASRVLQETRLGTTPGQFLTEALRGAHTPLYASPQQRRGENPDPRDDVFALGVIWFQLLRADSQAEVPPDWRDNLADCQAPKAVLGLLERCLSSRPEKRPDHGAVLAEEIGKLLPGTMPAQTLVEPRQQEKSRPPEPDQDEGSPPPAGTPKGNGANAVEEKARPRVACPRCNKRLQVPPANLKGRTVPVQCPSCQHQFHIRGKPAAEPTVHRLQAGLKELQPGEVIAIPVSGNVMMRFASIPPGTFVMGSPANEPGRYDDEGPQHRVTLTRGSALGVTPVTQEQWQAVMGSNPSLFRGQANLPVEKVTWDDCQAFCQKLGQLTGKRFRLPTEAEWEYACRAGSTTAYSFGADVGKLGEYAWYDANSSKQTHPVGLKKPNAWGLLDMHGNVWEWCLDWYGAYDSNDKKDPQNDQGGVARVVRGGSWDDNHDYCRAAYRSWFAPAGRYNYVGLRVCFRLD